MMGHIADSTTTKTVAGAGATGASLLTMLTALQQAFPQQEWLSNPIFITGCTWLINMILIPLVSRQFARLAGK